jgi:hypothetical protein
LIAVADDLKDAICDGVAEGGAQWTQRLVKKQKSFMYSATGQDRDGGIGVFQPKTWADGDDFTCFGGRRWDEYLRRNIRTYSSMSREVLSALMITHVAKHNDVSESGFTTTPSAYIRKPDRGLLGMWCWPGHGAVVSSEIRHTAGTPNRRKPTKTAVFD